jgi:hypothetical protein
MPAILRRLSPVGWLAAALCATAGPAYLPTVGPPAIRFEKPAPVPAESPVLLPPLSFIEPRPAVPSAEPASPLAQPGPLAPAEPANPLVDVAPLDSVLPPNAPATVMDPSATNAALPDPSALAPQMFMKYFTGRPGTNGNGVSIYAPVGFVPPLPVAPPSSSASFQTTPPGKP